MATTDRPPAAAGSATDSSCWRRVAWLAVIWLAGVASLALVAGIIRLLMNAAGLRSG